MQEIILKPLKLLSFSPVAADMNKQQTENKTLAINGPCTWHLANLRWYFLILFT